MLKSCLCVLSTLCVACLPCAEVSAQTVGDVQKGAALFATHCSECHSMKEGKQKKGPSLFGIQGTVAGQQAGFAYSDAMKASAWVWNAETLSKYIANPKQALPGGKMKYDGLAVVSERQDLIAYLHSISK